MSFTSETKNRIEVPSLQKAAKMSSAVDVCRVNDKVPFVPFFLVYCLNSCKFQVLSSAPANNTTPNHKPVCFVQIHIYSLLHFPTRSILTATTAVRSMLMGTLVVIAARHHCIIVSTQLHGRLIQFINVSARKGKFLPLKMTEHCYRHPHTSSLLGCCWKIRRCFQTHFSFKDASKPKGIVWPKLKFHP